MPRPTIANAAAELLRDRRAMSAEELGRIDEEVAAAVAAAVRWAEESPPPDPAALTADVYVRYESETG